MAKFIDISGKRFGRLLVIDRAEPASPPTWNCVCDCGVQLVVSGNSLRSSNARSCGCLHRELVTTHGRSMASSNPAPEYRVWTSIKSRCHNPSAANFYKYGGRGISVCDKWRNSFEAFFGDMGERPSSAHSIDRFPDANGNYEPGNCRWATAIEQNNNRSNNRFIEIDGVMRTVPQWERVSGINRATIINRIKRGWSVSDAVFRPTS